MEDQDAAWSEDLREVCHQPVEVGIFGKVRCDAGVESIGRKKLFGGGMNEGDISGAVDLGFLPGDVEIALRQIDADDPGIGKFFGDGEGEDAGAAGEV